jgi:hypothetical protein
MHTGAGFNEIGFTLRHNCNRSSLSEGKILDGSVWQVSEALLRNRDVRVSAALPCIPGLKMSLHFSPSQVVVEPGHLIVSTHYPRIRRS